MPDTDPEMAVACSLSADEARERAETVRGELAAAYSGFEETEQGITIRFDGAEATLRRVATFVSNELRCCSFAEFSISVSPPFQATELRITGPDGTTQLFRDGLVSALAADST